MAGMKSVYEISTASDSLFAIAARHFSYYQIYLFLALSRGKIKYTLIASIHTFCLTLSQDLQEYTGRTFLGRSVPYFTYSFFLHFHNNELVPRA